MKIADIPYMASESELLLYGGILIVALAVVLAVICMITFTLTGRKIKSRLEKDYGKIQRYK